MTAPVQDHQRTSPAINLVFVERVSHLYPWLDITEEQFMLMSPCDTGRYYMETFKINKYGMRTTENGWYHNMLRAWTYNTQNPMHMIWFAMKSHALKPKHLQTIALTTAKKSLRFITNLYPNLEDTKSKAWHIGNGLFTMEYADTMMQAHTDRHLYDKLKSANDSLYELATEQITGLERYTDDVTGETIPIYVQTAARYAIRAIRTALRTYMTLLDNSLTASDQYRIELAQYEVSDTIDHMMSAFRDGCGSTPDGNKRSIQSIRRNRKWACDLVRSVVTPELLKSSTPMTVPVSQHDEESE